jgi:D-alanyl-D-alanine carboxypeptidase
MIRRVSLGVLVPPLVALACSPAPAAEGERFRSAGARPGPIAAPTAEPTAAPGPGDAASSEAPRFDGRVWRLPIALREEMRGTTWKPGCPVPLDDLRLLRFNHWGFDGVVKRGPMVVHHEVAEDVLRVFRRLFRARFPVKRVALTKEFVPEEFEPRISTPRSVTAAFNCRPVITPVGPGDNFSQHAYGLAIDINPVQNPYVTADGFVRNRMAQRYVDRSRRLTGMIHDGDIVVRSFEAIGWSWGGDWTGDQDYMHFSRTGG